MKQELLYFGTDPIWTILTRYLINMLVMIILIRFIYFRFTRKEEDIFTFFLMGTMIFLVCIFLQTVEVQMGMALGLFAVFSILRFRTSNFSFKSMAYFFTVIGVSSINALASFPNPIRGTIIVNVLVILTTLTLELFLRKTTLSRHQLIYERIDLLAPELNDQLLQDISQRIGKKIEKIEIKKIDLVKKTAELEVLYKETRTTSNKA